MSYSTCVWSLLLRCPTGQGHGVVSQGPVSRPEPFPSLVPNLYGQSYGPPCGVGDEGFSGGSESRAGGQDRSKGPVVVTRPGKTVPVVPVPPLFSWEGRGSGERGGLL